MKMSEPQSMKEIHKIREKLAEEWKKKPWNEVNRKMENQAIRTARKLKLPFRKSAILEKV